MVDLIAERAVQLGATAEGTVQIVAQRSSLKTYPIEISEGRAHDKHLWFVEAHLAGSN